MSAEGTVSRAVVVSVLADSPRSEGELLIDLVDGRWVSYTGTAAQLVAEGLIPEGSHWPQKGQAEYWDADGFEYQLSRRRPKGHKGSVKSWLELDNWRVLVTVKGRPSAWWIVEEKARALRDELFRQSPEGRRHFRAISAAYWTSRTDAAFQAFKSCVPGLVPPARKPKFQDNRAT